MNDINEDKLSMFIKVNTFYKDNQLEIDTLPILNTFFGELNDNITQIFEIAGDASAKITGVAKDKKQTKSNLIKAYLKVSTGYCMFTQINDMPLELKRFKMSQSALSYKRDNDLYALSQNLHTSALPHIAALLPFGVQPIDLDNLLAASAIFLQNIESPKTHITEKAAKNKALNAKIKSTSEFLKNRLDIAMSLLEFSKPSLYLNYKLVRKIDNTGSRKKPDYQGSIKPSQTRLIAELPYKSRRVFNIRNKGECPLIFSLSNNSKEMQVNTAQLAPGQKTTKLSTTLNPDTEAIFLIVKNPDTHKEGNFWIKLE